MLSLATVLNFRLGCVDIKRAYLQSGHINRTIFLRRPRELELPRNTLRRLLKLPYGISEVGRQWAKAIELWLKTSAGMVW